MLLVRHILTPAFSAPLALVRLSHGTRMMSQHSSTFEENSRPGRGRRPRNANAERNGNSRGRGRGRGRGGRGGNRRPNAHARANGDNAAWFKGAGEQDPWAGPRLLKPVPSTLGQDTVALLWLRNDLRLQDNPALTLACTAGLLAPIYIFDMTKYGRKNHSPWGFARVGPHRALFMKDSVLSLRKQLRLRGADMYLRVGTPVEEILNLAKDLATKLEKKVVVVASKETTWEETQEELAVEKGISKLASELNMPLEVHYLWSSTLHHPDDLPFNPAGPALPPTFTEYRKRVEARGGISVREELPIPENIPRFPLSLMLRNDPDPSLRVDLDIEGLADPHDYAFPNPLGVHPFDGGAEAAAERIKEYIWIGKWLAQYKDTRNKSGQRNTSSKFSPWLSSGCLSARTVYWNVKRFEEENGGETEQTYWMIFELMTRDYFRWLSAAVDTKLFALHGFSGRDEGSPIWERVRSISGRDKRNLQKWIDGMTGAPFVDANMRELKATGFMSNRGRQNVASFLIHDLRFPDWRAGAEYFEQQLIDHDVAANWGNWAYLAGVGSDPRAGRKFNVIKQSMDYEPDGWYISRWCPELLMVPPPHIHQPHLLQDDELELFDVKPGDYPRPITRLPTAPKNLADSLEGLGIKRSPEWAARVRQDFIDAGAGDITRTS